MPPFFYNYDNGQMLDAYDLTDPKEERRFYDEAERSGEPIIGVINYELFVLLQAIVF